MKNHVRSLPAVRWLLALSLALGAIWHPVLSALGEMHETVHALSDAQEVPITSNAAADEGTLGQSLHQLQQLAHCCANAVAAPAMTWLPPPALQRHAIGPQAKETVLTWPSGDPFRPPIVG